MSLEQECAEALFAANLRSEAETVRRLDYSDIGVLKEEWRRLATTRDDVEEALAADQHSRPLWRSHLALTAQISNIRASICRLRGIEQMAHFLAQHALHCSKEVHRIGHGI